MGKVGTLSEACESKGGNEDSGQREELKLGWDHEDRWLGNKVWPCSMPACMHMHVCVSAVPGSVLFHQDFAFQFSWQRAVVEKSRVCSWIPLA